MLQGCQAAHEQREALLHAKRPASHAPKRNPLLQGPCSWTCIDTSTGQDDDLIADHCAPVMRRIASFKPHDRKFMCKANARLESLAACHATPWQCTRDVESCCHWLSRICMHQVSGTATSMQ